MTTEEMKAALEDFKKSLPTYVSQEDVEKKFDTLKEEMKELDMSKELEELTKAVEAQGMEMRKFGSKEETPATVKDVLTSQVDALKAFAKGDRQETIQFKTDVTRASITDSTISMRLPDVGQLPTQRNLLAPLFAQGSISPGMGGVVRYIDQSAFTNNAAAVAEGAVKPESAMTWQEYTMALQKVAHNIPVTMEALNDIPFMESEINNNLLKYLDIKVDNYLWSGTGSAPQIKGIYTAAGAYTAAASGITDASIYDLIPKVSEGITAGTMYQPNYAIMNITDFNKMLLKKNSNNDYVRPDFANFNGPVANVAGVNIIISNSVTANTMLIGDFDYATLYRLGGTTLKVGWIDKQFVENMVTVQAETRLGLLVRNANLGAFKKVTDIDAALTTLAS